MTRKVRVRLWRNPLPDRLELSLIVVLRSVRVACRAGNRPNRSVVKSVMAAVKSNTRQSKWTSSPPFPPWAGPQCSSKAVHVCQLIQDTIRKSTRPPTIKDSPLAIGERCAARPAPNAARTASSRFRDSARASNKLATFEQAISSTNPTAPTSTKMELFESRTNESCKVIASENLFL